MSNLEQCQQLSELSTFLRNLPPNNFYQGTWAARIEGDLDRNGWEYCSIDEGDVEELVPGCGTVACIAGWSTRVHPDMKLIEGIPVNTATGRRMEEGFADAYGLTKPQGQNMCMAMGRDEWTEQDAADYIDHYLETGETPRSDWFGDCNDD